MCGRYTVRDPRRCLAEFSVLEKRPILEPRYNIAPSQRVWVIRVLAAGERRRLDLLRWGLADSPGPPGGLAMVRAESLTARSQRGAELRKRRCLLVADGFYEWRRTANRSFPYFVQRSSGAPFAMAGIWQLDACAVVTKPARPPVDAVHDRMPVLLPSEYHDAWLDPELDDLRTLTSILDADPGFAIETMQVGSRVNSPANDDATCTAPATRDDLRGEQFELFVRGAG